MRIYKFITLLLIVPLLSCNRFVLKEMNGNKKPRICLLIKITNEKHTQFAINLTEEISKLLNEYSQKRGDYTVSNDLENTDYVLKLTIWNTSIIDEGIQEVAQTKRDSIYGRYEDDNVVDSIKSVRRKKAVAANIIGNLISLPFGVVTIATPNNDIGPNYYEQQVLSSTQAVAFMNYKTEINTKEGKMKWGEEREQKFILTHMVKQEEQIRILLKDTLEYLRYSLPIFEGNK